MTHERSVAVVGDGAAGTLTVIALLRHAARTGVRLRVEWAGDGARGRGVAYATSAPWHRLNVPAAAMSLGDADDFPQWLAAHAAADSAARDAADGPGDDFARRGDYGSYLLDRLDAARAAARTAQLHEHRGRATDLSVDAAGVALVAGDGSVRVDRAVLATGVPTARPVPGLTPAAAAHPRLVADAWNGRLDEVTGAGTVLLIGTGLTMIDAALSLARRAPDLRLHAVSRSGLLPRRHLRDRCEPGSPAVTPRPGLTLDELVTGVEAQVAAAPQRWREVVDGLRPVTQDLWHALSHADQERFLREQEARWMRHRHRVAPAVAEEVDALRASGRLHVEAAAVEEVDAAGERLRVRLTGRPGGGTRQVEADWVVACVGLQYDVRLWDDPLTTSLLRAGLARSHPLGLGLDCEPDGALRTAAGPSPHLFTLGLLRRGDLYETVGIAELAGQATRLAEVLVG